MIRDTCWIQMCFKRNTQEPLLLTWCWAADTSCEPGRHIEGRTYSSPGRQRCTFYKLCGEKGHKQWESNRYSTNLHTPQYTTSAETPVLLYMSHTINEHTPAMILKMDIQVEVRASANPPPSMTPACAGALFDMHNTVRCVHACDVMLSCEELTGVQALYDGCSIY